MVSEQTIKNKLLKSHETERVHSVECRTPAGVSEDTEHVWEAGSAGQAGCPACACR